MPIVLPDLLAYPIPDVHQVLTPNDAAYYALSIGIGQDPMDTTALQLVDPDKIVQPLPSIVVVLCHPGFWIAGPATGVDAVRVVHGEQGFAIHGPIPMNQPIVGRTRVTGVIDKGPGRGALIYSEKTLSVVATGAVFATTTSTTFARNDGGFGGPVGPARPPHPMPESAPTARLALETRPEQALFYRLNGDMNPLHSDPEVAARAGFPRPILHGLATLGVVCHALLRLHGDGDPACLQALHLRFSAPVFPGETIETELWDDGSVRARVAGRDVVAIDHGHARFRKEHAR